MFIGDAILIFCAYIGVASLIRTTPFLFTPVRFSARFTCCSSAQKSSTPPSCRRRRRNSSRLRAATAFCKSLTLSLTNPKAILFYVSFFVQFIDFNYAHTGCRSPFWR